MIAAARSCSTLSGSGRPGEMTPISLRLGIHANLQNRDTGTTATRPTRSRSVTAHGYAERFNPVEEEPEPEPPRITIPKLGSRNRSPASDAQSPGGYALRPSLSRTSTHESASNGYRDESPARRITRVTTESSALLSNLRPVRQANTFAGDYEDDYAPSHGNSYRRERSPPSPATSSISSARGNAMSRAASWTAAAEAGGNAKKAPPPPPPSRAKKPPPPPPMKRSALSANEVARY